MQKQTKQKVTDPGIPTKKLHKHSRPLDDEPGVELATVEVEYGRRDFGGWTSEDLITYMGGEGKGVMETA